MSGGYRPIYKFTLEEYNDGKQKWQSYECSVTEEVTQFYVTGYGENAKEAKEDMLKDLDNYINELLRFRQLLEDPKDPCVGCIYNPSTCCIKNVCGDKKKYNEELEKRKELK